MVFRMNNLVQQSPLFSKPLQIGTITVKRPLVLAPMAGVTDRWYRRIMAEYGAGLVTTEMISAEGLIRRNRNTLSMLASDPDLPVPLAVQLFGARPESMAEAARIVEQSGAALIDINVGCPVRKVTRQGAGATLLRQLELLQRLVGAVKNAVRAPVTVKIRLGWDAASINVLESASRVVDAGADAITLHARTAVQGYAGTADWPWIHRLKAAVPIPVIGNGDVTSPDLAHQLLMDTQCDGVMIGRGSLGNPWIFGAAAACAGHLAATGPDPTWTDFYTTLQTHLEGLRQDRSDRSPGLFRKVIGWYLIGCPGVARLRQQLAALSTPQAMLELCRSAVENWEARGVSLAAAKLRSHTGHENQEQSVFSDSIIFASPHGD
jgi:tRNA-dihydrouridine synthase B